MRWNDFGRTSGFSSVFLQELNPLLIFSHIYIVLMLKPFNYQYQNINNNSNKTKKMTRMIGFQTKQVYGINSVH